MISATQTILFSTSLMLLSSLLRIAAADEQPPRIAIADFTTEENSYRAELAAVDFSTALQALLANEPGVEWVERAQLAAAEKEHALPALGFADPDRSLKLGKWAKADLMLTGWFHDKTETNQTLRLEVIDLAKGELLVSTNVICSLARLEAPSQIGGQVDEVANQTRKLVIRSVKKYREFIEQPSVIVLYFGWFGRTGSKFNPWVFRQTNEWTTPLRGAIEAALTNDLQFRLSGIIRPGDAGQESLLLAAGLSGDDGQRGRKLADLCVWGGFTTHETYEAVGSPTNTLVHRLISLDLSIWDGVGKARQLTNVISSAADPASVMQNIRSWITATIKNPAGVAELNQPGASPGDLMFQRARWYEAVSDHSRDAQRIRHTLDLLESTVFVDPDHREGHERLTFLRWTPNPYAANYSRDAQYRHLWKASEAWGDYVDRFGLDTLGTYVVGTALPEGQSRVSRHVAANYLLYPQQLIGTLSIRSGSDFAGLPDIDNQTLKRWRDYWTDEFIKRLKKAAHRPEVAPFAERIIEDAFRLHGATGMKKAQLRAEVIEALWPAVVVSKQKQGLNTLPEGLRIDLRNTYHELDRAKRGEELLLQITSIKPQPEKNPLPLPRAAALASFVTNRSKATSTPSPVLSPTVPAARPVALATAAGEPAFTRTNVPIAKLITSTDPLVLDFAAISNRWGQANLEVLTAKAVEGVAEAQSFLAWRTENGKGLQTNKKVAADWYRRSAEQGLAAAQRRLGWLYRDGIGVAKDRELALHWMRRAAEQGLTSAEFGLGWFNDSDGMLAGGLGNYQEAAEWYEKAALKNHPDAQYRLGRLYDAGHVKRDNDKRDYWYRLAAAQGQLSAMVELAESLLYKGPAGIQEAIVLLQTAADRNHPPALYELGLLYALGEVVPRDVDEGRRLIVKAGDLGDLNAHTELRRIDRRIAADKALGGSSVTDASTPRLLAAAEQGDVRAQLELARRYEYNQPPDLAESLRWYERAIHEDSFDRHAQRGAKPSAQCAEFLLRNPGFEIREPKTLIMIDAMARDASGGALGVYWGERRMHGRRVTGDVQVAANIFEHEVWWGSPVACLRLGELWDSDLTHNHEPAEAVRFFRLAADRGLAEAQHRMGKACLDGYGVESNAVEAWRWLTLSAEQGDGDARKAVESLTPTLSAEELIQARALVESFHRNQMPEESKAKP